jgi:vacuolar-type H+-ATPase subunit I/STV1
MLDPTAVIRPLLLSSLLLLLAAQTPFAHAQGKEFYRYRNAEGNVVVDHRVPPEYVAGGYEVLSDRGVVVRVVPRTPSEEERAGVSEQQRLEAAAQEEEERLRKWDEALLLRYSSVADIESARDRALRDLRVRVTILQGNRHGLRQQVESHQARAANLERRGSEVEEALTKAIADLQREIGIVERQIAEHEREVTEVEKSFAADMQRFSLLEEALQSRRAAARQQD